MAWILSKIIGLFSFYLSKFMEMLDAGGRIGEKKMIRKCYECYRLVILLVLFIREVSMQLARERKRYAPAIKSLGGTAFTVILILLSACATIPVEKRPQIRKQLVSTADSVLAEFFAADPAIEAAFDKSVGYFAGEASMAMAGLVGGKGSIGVLYDKEKNERSFLNISVFEFGLGAGSSDFKLLVLFKTTEALEKVKKGLWVGGTTTFSMTGKYGGLYSAQRKGWTAHVISKHGIVFGGGLTLSKVEINRELTDLGISEIRFPNRDLDDRDDQDKAAPRKWERTLPFMAQKVIDKGFDLPLPWGIGLTVAGVDQEMDLSNLSAGFNGGPLRQFPSVSLNNSQTDTQSFQLKLDAWLFPFMNVFAMAGQVKGDFQMDVGIDGNTILNEIGVSCSGIIKPKICSIQNQTVTLPVRTDVDAFTYGVGATLAAGWNNWFVSIPMSANWTNPEGSVADGVAYTITPRGGRVVSLGGFGNIAAFGGGNWLHSKYTITGTFNVPDADLAIDYIIDQESRDNWTLLVGFNWDFSRRMGWAFEYNGFIGSRKAIISSFVYRF